MIYEDYLDLVPPQKSGTSIEVESYTSFPNVVEAKEFYEIAKERLLDINNWHHLAGFVSAKFKIISPELEEVERNICPGDFVKIDIPGPGSSEGGGYDWVHAEDIKEKSEDEMQSIGLQLRPSINPLGNTDDIAHFYADGATSNFIVTRKGNQLSAFIIDRNLKPNAETGSLVDKIRNSGVGIGAIGVFSKVQWKGLAEGFLKKD